MKSEPIDFNELAREYAKLMKMTHAGTVMLMSSRLERSLEWIIQGYMPNLSNRSRAKLFEGFGPLSHFSAKIDLAFALGLITEPDFRSLHAIREIRNEFAHADNEIHFDHPSLTKLLAKLPKTGKAKVSPIELFLDVVIACNKSMYSRSLLDAIKPAAAPQQT